MSTNNSELSQLVSLVTKRPLALIPETSIEKKTISDVSQVDKEIINSHDLDQYNKIENVFNKITSDISNSNKSKRISNKLKTTNSYREKLKNKITRDIKSCSNNLGLLLRDITLYNVRLENAFSEIIITDINDVDFFVKAKVHNIYNKFLEFQLTLETGDSNLISRLNLYALMSELYTVINVLPNTLVNENIVELLEDYDSDRSNLLRLSDKVIGSTISINSTEYPIVESNVFLPKELELDNSELYSFYKGFIKNCFSLQ